MRVLGLLLASLSVCLAAPQVIFLLPRHFLNTPQPGEPNPFENLNINDLIRTQSTKTVGLLSGLNQSLAPIEEPLVLETEQNIVKNETTQLASDAAPTDVVPQNPGTADAMISEQNLNEPPVIAAEPNVAENEIIPQEPNQIILENRSSIVSDASPVDLIEPIIEILPEPASQIQISNVVPPISLFRQSASFIVNSPLKHLTLGSIAVPKHLLPLTPRELVAKAANENFPSTTVPTTAPVDVTTTIAPSTSTSPSTTAAQEIISASSTVSPTVASSSTTESISTPGSTTLAPEITTFSRKNLKPAVSNVIPGSELNLAKSLFGHPIDQGIASEQTLQSIGSPVVTAPVNQIQPAFDPLSLVDPRFRQFIYPNDSPQVVAAKIALFRLHAAHLPPLSAPAPVV